MKKIFFIFNNSRKQDIFFVIFLLIIFYVYNFQEILFLKPQGVHFIRQTDSLSFVIGYFKYSMNFFEPRNLNLTSIDGKGVSEFPILYYLTACLYFVFGEHEYILRLLNISIVSVGFFYLFRLLIIIIQNVFYAFIFTFLFLSSTVLIYYTNNFLPDAPALGLALIGWYFFYTYLLQKKRSTLITSFVFFTLSSLLKVTFFINPIAAFLTVSYLFIKQKNRLIMVVLTFLTSCCIVLSWVLFVFYYNKINQSNYYSTSIHPIWKLPAQYIKTIWGYITEYWYTKYYFQSTFHIFFLLIIGGIISVKKIKKELLIISSLLLIGSIFYFLLFYEMFKDHDYYFITLLTPIFFLIIASFQGLKTKFPKFVNHFSIKLMLLVICLLSINYSRKKLAQRYTNNIDAISIIGDKLNNIESCLTSLAINKSAKFIVANDLSENGGLYFLKRQGWTIKKISDTTPLTIQRLIKKGANYLLITGKFPSYLANKYKLETNKNGIAIFKLN